MCILYIAKKIVFNEVMYFKYNNKDYFSDIKSRFIYKNWGLQNVSN